LGEQLVKNIAHPIRAFRLRIGEDTSEQEVLISDETAEPPELPSAPATISELTADNEVALELALWDSVKEGSPAELESYLEQYPEGNLRLARPNPARCSAIVTKSRADARGSRRRSSRSRFLELREGQR
jgi:hypothetical protein